jgi:hypothetical protein
MPRACQAKELRSCLPGIGLRSGISTDGTRVALIFQTTEGVPIEVTMPPNLAHETIERLSMELDRLKTGPTIS